jgi:hypothetical protein
MYSIKLALATIKPSRLDMPYLGHFHKLSINKELRHSFYEFTVLMNGIEIIVFQIVPGYIHPLIFMAV